MAQVTKRIGTNGKTSFLIRVSNGYGTDGKQRKKSMTWVPPQGMSAKKAEKQAQLEAIKFEEAVNAGTLQDGTIRFEAFAARWLDEYCKKQLKPKTWTEYEKMLKQINQAIGHIKLQDIRTGHLNTFYSNLQEKGMRRDGKCTPTATLAASIKKAGFTQKALAETAGVSIGTIKAALDGKNLSTSCAAKIASALQLSRSELFIATEKATLKPNTVHAYHRVISSILSKAVKWGFIPFNVAINAELPKAERKEAICLDEDDARRMLMLLHHEPIKYRAAITFDLLSGLRRGELLGLHWSDVDFSTETITISETLSYVSGIGLYTDTPKNKTSARVLKLSRSAFVLLNEYKLWQDAQQELLGDRFQNQSDYIFTNEEGAPLHPDALTKWFHRFVSKNSFPDVHIHSLRHTYASLMIADGTPLVVVSKRMGHAQVSTTANIYAHVISSADEKAALVTEQFADVISSNPIQMKQA